MDINCSKIFVPVVKWSTIRTVIALTTTLGWPILHLDVVTGFFYGRLQEVICIQQPPKFEVWGWEHMVSLASLPINLQVETKPKDVVHKNWHISMRTTLTTQFLQSQPLHFTPRFEYNFTSSFCWWYVIDKQMNDRSLVDLVKHQLHLKYKMKELGTQWYLGVDFLYSPKIVFICQKPYAWKILSNARLHNCKSTYLPLLPSTSLDDWHDSPDFDQTRYCHTVGKLLYFTNSHHTLDYAIGYISRFMAHPTKAVGIYINCFEQSMLDNMFAASVPTQNNWSRYTCNANNLSVVKLAWNPILHATSKHIKIHASSLCQRMGIGRRIACRLSSHQGSTHQHIDGCPITSVLWQT